MHNLYLTTFWFSFIYLKNIYNLYINVSQKVNVIVKICTLKIAEYYEEGLFYTHIYIYELRYFSLTT